MDILFYRILLLFVGLAFLFIQSGEYKSFKIKLEVLPQFTTFFGWAGFAFLPSSKNNQKYPPPLLIVSWQELINLSEDALLQFKTDLKQRNQSLIVIYPVFMHNWQESINQFQHFKDLPISYWEFGATIPNTFSREWQESLISEYVSEFGELVGEIRREFPRTQFFAWGAFQKPTHTTQQIWNHLLASQQNNLQGYTLVIDTLNLQTFQALLKIKSNLSHPQNRARLLSLHLKNKDLELSNGFSSSLFILNSILQLPLAYLSYQDEKSEESLISTEMLLSRILWRVPRLQNLQFKAEATITNVHLQGWYWQKNWETGVILINLGNETQRIHTADLFPSFFFQEVFTISAVEQEKPQLSTKKTQGFHKVVVPPHSLVFLSTKSMLPHSFSNDTTHLLGFKIELISPNTLKMEYHLADYSRNLHIRLFDMKGEEIYAWQQQDCKKGYYKLNHQIKHLSAGEYLCCVDVENENLLKTIEIDQDIQS